MHVAGRDMRLRSLPDAERRVSFLARRLGERAACVKAAALGRINWVWRIAADRRLLDPPGWVAAALSAIAIYFVIAGLLGGNVAERLIFGDTTTGASNDIEKATDLARRMVTEFGMSDKLGPLSFGKRDEMVFLGRSMGEQRDYSDEVARTIDEEVRAIIDRAYERATEVLTTHKDKLVALAEKLVAEETVDAEGFEGLFSDFPPKLDINGNALVYGNKRAVPAPDPQPA